jgi:hypothetical protein
MQPRITVHHAAFLRVRREAALFAPLARSEGDESEPEQGEGQG